MKAWAVVEAGKPLEHIDLPTPEPKGTEVLLEVTHCGVCRSDLHFWHGYYDLGGGNRLKLSDRGVTLPRAPGHEIVGRVVKLGPDAVGVSVGDRRVVYPWIGCGTCAACLRGEENLCARPHQIGCSSGAAGGFATHVIVPHPKYLLDYGAVPPALACTYMCSGLTAYAAATTSNKVSEIRFVAALHSAVNSSNAFVIPVSFPNNCACRAGSSGISVESSGMT